MILLPFPWESHGTHGIPVSPIPMHTSSFKYYFTRVIYTHWSVLINEQTKWRLMAQSLSRHLSFLPAASVGLSIINLGQLRCSTPIHKTLWLSYHDGQRETLLQLGSEWPPCHKAEQVQRFTKPRARTWEQGQGQGLDRQLNSTQLNSTSMYGRRC